MTSPPTDRGRLVYQLAVTRDHYNDPAARAVINAFLTAHGIDPALFLVGNTITVRLHGDGSLWLHTHRALEGHPMCPTCPGCLAQESVTVPLAAAAAQDMRDAYGDVQALASVGVFPARAEYAVEST